MIWVPLASKIDISLISVICPVNLFLSAVSANLGKG